uniref:Tyrosinase copper-binding domain-containing protein n=1 Tax=Chromera velia CCMP2878 TaxID=1169474 RepID=A0A0G4HRH3_9ALVE|eukprot:Cvel_30615.t1-p1 / transcript=Cvel_30615.t1 / gene=Cvel_30615 / organism=Chromera_velia_CCMP2878 / gene_product=hypothetical protein / transcript_product=hypothetical protein / location=Cvel_scaffold4394:5431-6498(+) / protein_length=356 / sequence_SO=supercontig / SO=protein_coding / is_pseudo=false
MNICCFCSQAYMGDLNERRLTGRSIQELSEEEVERLVALHFDFVSEIPVVDYHMEWHCKHGIGGLRHVGGGEEFLLFHHGLSRLFESYLLFRQAPEFVPVPYWNTEQPLPPKFTNPLIEREEQMGTFKLPRWLTLEMPAFMPDAERGEKQAETASDDLFVLEDFVVNSTTEAHAESDACKMAKQQQGGGQFQEQGQGAWDEPAGGGFGLPFPSAGRSGSPHGRLRARGSPSSRPFESQKREEKPQQAASQTQTIPLPRLRLSSLHDARTLDELGLSMCLPTDPTDLKTTFHARGHKAAGGTMATWRAPLDPLFFAFHSLMDRVTVSWLYLTHNGRSWRADRSGRPGWAPREAAGMS